MLCVCVEAKSGRSGRQGSGGGGDGSQCGYWAVCLRRLCVFVWGMRARAFVYTCELERQCECMNIDRASCL